MKKKIINVVSLGCSKNLIDSEFLMRQLKVNNYKVLSDSNDTNAKIVIINTCGFINDAKEESVDTILQFVNAKKAGLIEKIFVMGCLTERYKNDLQYEIPEVDGYFGKFEIENVLKAVGGEYKYDFAQQRLISTPGHYAYLKISEGCDRTCSFCAIPLMTGSHKSKPIEVIMEEAKNLIDQGVKELLIIAQDLSYYGIDLYKQKKLAELIDKLSDLPKLEWIKLHYAYPANFPLDVLKVMNSKPNVCKYLDIALQHISDKMLLAMRRNIDKNNTIGLIEKIRNEVPGIVLRTTMLVGHPGETNDDFDELKSFVQSAKFERLGVFTYSHEENTYAAMQYTDSIPKKIKIQRQNEIMEIQKGISKEFNSNLIGKNLKILIDRNEGEYFIGRTEFDSPEVDGEVIISSHKKISVGKFYEATITDSSEYDLFASIE